MSTGPQHRRFPIRQAAIAAAVVAVAVVVLLVLIGGDGGPEVSDTIQVGAAPAGITVGFDRVWVVNNDGGTLTRVDPDSKKVDGRPVQVASPPSTYRRGRIGMDHCRARQQDRPR